MVDSLDCEAAMGALEVRLAAAVGIKLLTNNEHVSHNITNLDHEEDQWCWGVRLWVEQQSRDQYLYK